MPLTQPTYRIALDDLANEVEVVILPADQLRAEVEGNRRGLVDPKHQGQLLTFLWLWAACRRLDLIDRASAFDPFVDRLLAWEPVRQVDPATGEPADPLVPPTGEAGSSTSASSSLASSPELTGSEPSSTTPLSSPQPSESSSPHLPTTTEPIRLVSGETIP